MDLKTIDKIARKVTEKIITPVVYMLEDEERIELVCYCDENIKMQELHDAETAVEAISEKRTEIVDIREYCEADRVDILRDAELIYVENPLVERLFEMSVYEDLHNALTARRSMLQRYRETGSHYLQ